MTEIEIKTTDLSWEKYEQIAKIGFAGKLIKGFFLASMHCKPRSKDILSKDISPEITIIAIKHN